MALSVDWGPDPENAVATVVTLSGDWSFVVTRRDDGRFTTPGVGTPQKDLAKAIGLGLTNGVALAFRARRDRDKPGGPRSASARATPITRAERLRTIEQQVQSMIDDPAARASLLAAAARSVAASQPAVEEEG